MIEIAITIDDPHLREGPLLLAEARDEKIREALKNCTALQAALFVCGQRLDSAQGGLLLEAWGSENHLLGNHTFSHLNLSSEKTSAEEFIRDTERCHKVISGCNGFSNLFRYPFLKGGDTREKRDAVRGFLKAGHYRQGYVSIDASDWCIDARLERALKNDSETDRRPYRDFYLSHIKERVLYYDTLSRDVLGRSIKHTLLIHHNLLNAFFLDDLLKYLQEEAGCRLIDAGEAYKDPIYRSEPDIVPFGESIVWALARENGSFEARLRYPAEDECYERVAMDHAGL